MNNIPEEEKEKLSIMYEGDKNRDATEKIRGFLFQDYVAIMCLLEDGVESVFSEYIEDVSVVSQDNTFKFIQVKHYPNTTPDKKEIFTDLYYQYLRLKMLRSNYKPKPLLYIHGKSHVKKPDLSDMKTYIKDITDLATDIPENKELLDYDDSVNFLKDIVYKENKKNQKKELFKEAASVDSINDFLAKCEVKQLNNIERYKSELLDKLDTTYPSTYLKDKDNWKRILLGLAVSFIQRRYSQKDPSFDDLLFEKNIFNKYMIEGAQLNTEQSIVNYLVGLASERFIQIMGHNDFTKFQIFIMNHIYKNTINWIKDNTSDIEGQFKLLYTISKDEIEKVENFKSLTVDDRFSEIVRCGYDWQDFLSYLWKIMLDICQEQIKDINNIQGEQVYMKLFDPATYIDSNVTGYVCLKFPEDNMINTIILPKVGDEFVKGKRIVVERMIDLSPKPAKWFMQNSGLMWGKNYYDYSTANACEDPSVIDLGEDSFYIECMRCIGIDEGKWCIPDECSKCIFTEKCVNEGRER